MHIDNIRLESVFCRPNGKIHRPVKEPFTFIRDDEMDDIRNAVYMGRAKRFFLGRFPQSMYTRFGPMCQRSKSTYTAHIAHIAHRVGTFGGVDNEVYIQRIQRFSIFEGNKWSSTSNVLPRLLPLLLLLCTYRPNVAVIVVGSACQFITHSHS